MIDILYHLLCFIPSPHFTVGGPISYLPTLPVFLGVSKFFIKSRGLSECLLGDFGGLFLNIIFNDILTMQRLLDISRFLYSGGLNLVRNTYSPLNLSP